MRELSDELEAEHADLDAVVAPLADGAWDQPTPADGWTIRDSVSHLWFFDLRAMLALDTDRRDEYDRDTRELMSAVRRGGLDPSVAVGRAIPPGQLLAEWRADRQRLLDLARRTDPSARVPWYGPDMAARSLVTARLMETWAHAQDVRDALHLAPAQSGRLRHVAHIGVRARSFAFATNGQPAPNNDVRVELVGPDGDEWTWGDADAPDRVTGPAVDFCLAVTQRRHVADTRLAMEGETAREWMRLAQAFAGPPGPGRQPGQFATTTGR
jgi:uncharacterized protein (TIGR03084 family)